MSRYNGGSNGSTDGDNDYEDDTTLKLKPYSTVRFTPTETTAHTHEQFGTSFIQNYEDAAILDGIALQREDKPGTWNIYSADEFFHLNPEDGRVYEQHDEEAGEYSTEMSAQDILEHPRVLGHSTSGANKSYYFNPIGVVIEGAEDIAIAEDADVETTDDPGIVVGGASMLVNNKAWTRTFAKKMLAAGGDAIADNGKESTERGKEEVNPKYKDFGWLASDDPNLREDLEGREVELWVTRETNNFGDGGSVTYTVPNLIDSKTGEAVTIDNGGDDESEAESGGSTTEKAAAADGGTTVEASDESSATESTESPETTDTGLPNGVPDHMEGLLDYMARNGQTDPADIRQFAADEVDDPDAVDWEAASEVAQEMAE